MRSAIVLAAAIALAAAATASAAVTASLLSPSDDDTFYTGAAAADSTHKASVELHAKLDDSSCTSGLWYIERADEGKDNWASVTGSTVQEKSELTTVDAHTFAGDFEYRVTINCQSPQEKFESQPVLVHIRYGSAPVPGPSCGDAEEALAKARAKLRKLRKRHASKAKIKRAKKQVAARRLAADQACG